MCDWSLLPEPLEAVRDVPGGRPVLTIDRHGSLPIDEVRRVVERFGDVELGPHARRRLQVRNYPAAVRS